MSRALLASFAVVAALAATTGTALAAKPPVHLGKPDVNEPISGTFFLPFSAATSACAGFATGDSLTFTDVTFDGRQKIWQLDAIDNWIEERERDAGTATSGGYTYTLDARLTYAGLGFDDIVGAGRVVIARNDGARMVGDATVFLDSFNTFTEQVLWSGTPTCK
jgi:hypothetical protein